MKRIRNITAKIPGLERIAGQAAALEQLTGIVRSAVPESMRQHVLACAVRERILVLFTDNAAWGSQLRFIESAILDAIATQTGHRLDSVRLKIQQAASSRPVSASPASSKPHDKREISDHSRALIESAADGISDPDLAAALHRLARGRDQDA